MFKDYDYDKVLVDLKGDVIDNFGLYGYIRINLSDMDKAKLLNTLDKIKCHESMYIKDSRDNKRIKECIVTEVLLVGNNLVLNELMIVMLVLAGVSASYDVDYLADVFGIEKANVLTYIKSNIFN